MKRCIYFLIMAPIYASMMGQTDNWSNVTIIENTYAQSISNNGEWIVGYSDEGGTVVFNRTSNNAQYFPGIDYGRGHIVADNGWVVGGKMSDDEPNKAIVIKDGITFTPDVFDLSVSGNIHSITPDGKRICGNVGSKDPSVEYKAFYCDIDENGKFDKLQYLPAPKDDFFGDPIQYASAMWLSADGKTIAGQVISARGFAVYPIIYYQQSDGSWQYELPSEKLFNMDKLTVPDPIPEIEALFPDAPYPELEDYMDPDQYLKYLLVGGNPDDFMTPQQIEEYYEAVDIYFAAVEEYMELFDTYMDQYWKITDCSVFFERNNMALSPDGKWLVTSAEIEDISNPYNPVKYLTPYLCNLETGEWMKFGDPELQYHSNQVLNDGTCFVNIISDGLIPATTYVYLSNTDDFISFDKYVTQTNPQFKEWFQKYLTSNIIIGGDYDNPDFSDEPLTVTGQGVVSNDRKVITAGVDGFTLDKNMYFSYIMSDLNFESGIESIEEDILTDGVFHVYNLQGVNILSSKNIEDFNSLSPGIYIVNNKKFIKK